MAHLLNDDIPKHNYTCTLDTFTLLSRMNVSFFPSGTLAFFLSVSISTCSYNHLSCSITFFWLLPYQCSGAMKWGKIKNSTKQQSFKKIKMQTFFKTLGWQEATTRTAQKKVCRYFPGSSTSTVTLSPIESMAMVQTPSSPAVKGGRILFLKDVSLSRSEIWNGQEEGSGYSSETSRSRINLCMTLHNF